MLKIIKDKTKCFVCKSKYLKNYKILFGSLFHLQKSNINCGNCILTDSVPKYFSYNI